MRKAFLLLVGVLALGLMALSPLPDWQTLPLVKNGKVHPSWVQIGFGGFVVEGDTLRTDPAAEGIGLLAYTKEKFGNCQLRVVFKPKEARSNSGFYVRIDDGILDQTKKPGEKFVRDTSGKISDESMKKAQ